jgi:hypothetical protein
MPERPPIRKVSRYVPPGASAPAPAPAPPARESLHVQVAPRLESAEPALAQSTKSTGGPYEARGEAEAPGGPLTRPGPRKARGGAARAVLGPGWSEAFGDRLSLALAGRCLTPGTAARALGISPTAVRHWCKGRRLPTLARLVHAVTVLRLDPPTLFPEWFR